MEEKKSYLNHVSELCIDEKYLANDKRYTSEEVYYHLANVNRNAIFTSGNYEIFNNTFGCIFLHPFLRDWAFGLGFGYFQDHVTGGLWRLKKREIIEEAKIVYTSLPIIDCSKGYDLDDILFDYENSYVSVGDDYKYVYLIEKGNVRFRDIQLNLMPPIDISNIIKFTHSQSAYYKIKMIDKVLGRN